MANKMTLDEALKTIDDLKAEIEKLRESMPVGMSGWLITAPNKAYSGITLGVMFRGGQAFIPDGPGAEKIAKEMSGDLGYEVRRVEDWRNMGQGETEKVRRSMIDVIGTPQAM